MRHLLLAAVILASYVATGQTGFAQSPVAKIIGALDSQNKTTRFQAAAALGNYGKGASTAAPALKALVDREQEPQVALQAVQALTQIGAHAELRALLQHPALHIRQQAVWGLALIGPPAKKAVPELLPLLSSDQPLMPELAVHALSEIGVESEADARALLALLGAFYPEVRQYALMAVMNLGPNAVPGLEKNLSDQQPIYVRTASLQALANQGPDAKSTVPTLTKLLKDPDADVRALSAVALAAIGSNAKDALPALLDRLLDNNVKVQMFAFQAAVAIGQEDRRALSVGLKSANAKGRWAAPLPLAGKNAVPGLIKNLSEKDSGTRIAASLALGRIGKDAEPAIPPLTRMLKDENKQVQNAARQALAQLDQKNAETYFKKLRLEQEQWLRDAKIQQAKFAAERVKLVKDTQLGFLKADKLQAWEQMQRANIANEKLSVAVRNGPQQAYLRRLVMMHIHYSSMQNPPPDADWVRGQISDTGIEAVPALVEAFNLGAKYDIGFC